MHLNKENGFKAEADFYEAQSSYNVGLWGAFICGGEKFWTTAHTELPRLALIKTSLREVASLHTVLEF